MRTAKFPPFPSSLTRFVVTALLVRAAIAGSLSAAESTATSAPVELDLPHAAALWCALTKQDIKPNEILRLYLQPHQISSLNEFQLQRAIQDARSKYNAAFRRVRTARLFRITSNERLGNYDFSAKGFPLVLPPQEQGYLTVQRRLGLGEDAWTTSNGYRIWFRNPEAIRMIEVSEKKAEALMPRLVQTQRKIEMEPLLSPVSASIRNKANGYDDLMFETEKVVIAIPSQGKQYRSFSDQVVARLERQEEAMGGKKADTGKYMTDPQAAVVLETWEKSTEGTLKLNRAPAKAAAGDSRRHNARDVMPEEDDTYEKAKARYLTKNYDAALRSARSVVEGNPQHWRAHSLIGNCLYQKGDVRAALAAYQESLTLNPDNSELREWVENLRSSL